MCRALFDAKPYSMAAGKAPDEEENCMRNAPWLLACAIVLTGGAGASETTRYPERPLRVILPNAPGYAPPTCWRDVLTRMLERLGRQIVVDNRPGAGGTLGMETAARAAPDGYTIVAVAASMLTITPHVYRKLAYDPLRDFVPISTVYVLAQTALCVHAPLPVKTVREFVELAKNKPASLNMASAGIGSTSHLGGLLLATRAGFEANHVPYKGGGPSIASGPCGKGIVALWRQAHQFPGARTAHSWLEKRRGLYKDVSSA